MGLSNLFRFCFTFLFTSSLAFANEVNINVSPTTSYYTVSSKTVDFPKGSTVSAVKDVAPSVTPHAGGFQQAVKGSVTITGIEKPVPFTAKARAAAGSVKNAAKAFFKNPVKRNLAYMAGAYGLQQLLDSVDWVMTDGGKINKISSSGVDVSSPSWTGYYWIIAPTDPHFATPQGACDYRHNNPNLSTYAVLDPSGSSAFCVYHVGGVASTPTRFGSGCPSGEYSSSMGGCVTNAFSPISSSEIDSSIDSSYVPDPSDLQVLSSNLIVDDIELTSLPRLDSEPKFKTIKDAEGNTIEVQETNTWHDFDISWNPSKQPKVDVKTTEEIKTYIDGVLAGTSTSTSTTPASGEAGSSGGGSSTPVEFPEIPTDCDFHPTLCAWMEWTKEPLGEDDHDLSQIMHTADFSETKTISFGSKSCPAPYDIYIAIVEKTYQLSFQPACDFAGYLYFFVMAAAYIFAAYISVGVVRNG